MLAEIALNKEYTQRGNLTALQLLHYGTGTVQLLVDLSLNCCNSKLV